MCYYKKNGFDLGGKMRSRKYLCLLVVACLVFYAVLSAIMKRQGPIAPLSWGSIISTSAFALGCLITGLYIILFPKDWLNLLSRFGPEPPTWSLRLLGIFWLFSSFLLFALTIWDIIAALGLIPSPYSYSNPSIKLHI